MKLVSRNQRCTIMVPKGSGIQRAVAESSDAIMRRVNAAMNKLRAHLAGKYSDALELIEAFKLKIGSQFIYRDVQITIPTVASRKMVIVRFNFTLRVRGIKPVILPGTKIHRLRAFAF